MVRPPPYLPVVTPSSWDEPPTERGNNTQVLYQTLLGLFDTLDPKERMEFLEFASLFRDLHPEDRAMLVEEANQLACKRSRKSRF